MATNWESQYDNGYYSEKLEIGKEYQDFVIDVLAKEVGLSISNYSSKKYQFNIGENKQGIEIKFDSRFLETERLSIEIAEKSHPNNKNWIPSGIYRDDNSWLYIQGNYDVVYIFGKNVLKLLHQSGRNEEHPMPTIKKFYLPLEDADKYCAKKVIINA